MSCVVFFRMLSKRTSCVVPAESILAVRTVSSKARAVSCAFLNLARCYTKSTAPPRSGQMATIYDFTVKNIDGNDVSLKKYEGRVCLIVNVASKCGFTQQYVGLQKLHEKYFSRGFSVLGFPCNQFGSQEPASEEEIKKFTALKYNVTFDLFKKVDVNGDLASPLWSFLKSEQHGFLGDNIKWNFTKFLVDRQGKPVKRYGSTTEPDSLVSDIEEYLQKATHNSQAKL
ncbi:glutathione peroxidase-like [Tropilaelaps mercedesae]|uniref:Glutathione peroxidase n=1 Tax=Tropilaelaps mercedesae TaxID=418985 RepID=A0A1V9XLZ4_9ACAR|nr:glutathione peroxidase-like [Tropilaelaps mercedesae]